MSATATDLPDAKPRAAPPPGKAVLRPRNIAGAVITLAIVCIGLFASFTAAKADTAEASAARYTIAVFANPPADGCFTPGSIRAIEHFVKRRIASLNALPDLKDRQLRVEIYNDKGDEAATVANVRKALDDPATLAMIGLSGSTRAKAVFEKLGKDIGDRGIPFITDLSVTGLFEPYANVFTMRPSQENERLPVITKFLQDGKYQRPAYVGTAGSLASSEILVGLSNRSDMAPLAAVEELTVTDGKMEPSETALVIQNLKTADADVVLAMLGATPIEQFLKDAAAAGLRAPILLLTESEKTLASEAAATYGANLYQLAWQTLPHIYSSRLREQMLADTKGPWIFEDVANKGAQGWSNGKCKAPDTTKTLGQLDATNLRAIGRGTRYADMAGLIGEIVRYSAPDVTMTSLRSHIIKSVKTKYASGRGAYRGEFDNWSFQPLSRTASQTPGILMRARNASVVRLAPRQYMKLRNDTLRPIQTLYMDVDLTRIFRIDDNEKSFFAEFFLTVTSADKFDVGDIEFANAYLDTGGGAQNISISALSNGQSDGIYPEGIQVFKVTGKFMLRPEFSHYPFDTQLFTVLMKPKSGNTAFIIQPPPENIRDITAETDGWLIKDQYVGYDEDYIPISDARSEEKSIVPFYQVGFSWIMEREATDYYLRVVIPLAFILIVAYLSIFIPREHFEAVVTIQVTALLSAVALYLSIPKVGADAATISDRIFLFDYMAVSLMIAISISRVNAVMRRFPWLESTLKVMHVLGIPLLVVAMAYYVANITSGKYAPAWHEESETVATSASIPVKSNFDAK